jgi:hypothetical protein
MIEGPSREPLVSGARAYASQKGIILEGKGYYMRQLGYNAYGELHSTQASSRRTGIGQPDGGIGIYKSLRYCNYPHRDRSMKNIAHENETHPCGRAGHQVRSNLQTKHLGSRHFHE